jgi:hypothetical protein
MLGGRASGKTVEETEGHTSKGRTGELDIERPAGKQDRGTIVEEESFITLRPRCRIGNIVELEIYTRLLCCGGGSGWGRIVLIRTASAQDMCVGRSEELGSCYHLVLKFGLPHLPQSGTHNIASGPMFWWKPQFHHFANHSFIFLSWVSPPKDSKC